MNDQVRLAAVRALRGNALRDSVTAALRGLNPSGLDSVASQGAMPSGTHADVMSQVGAPPGAPVPVDPNVEKAPQSAADAILVRTEKELVPLQQGSLMDRFRGGR